MNALVSPVNPLENDNALPASRRTERSSASEDKGFKEAFEKETRTESTSSSSSESDNKSNKEASNTASSNSQAGNDSSNQPAEKDDRLSNSTVAKEGGNNGDADGFQVEEARSANAPLSEGQTALNGNGLASSDVLGFDESLGFSLLSSSESIDGLVPETVGTETGLGQGILQQNTQSQPFVLGGAQLTPGVNLGSASLGATNLDVSSDPAIASATESAAVIGTSGVLSGVLGGGSSETQKANTTRPLSPLNPLSSVASSTTSELGVANTVLASTITEEGSDTLSQRNIVSLETPQKTVLNTGSSLSGGVSNVERSFLLQGDQSGLSDQLTLSTALNKSDAASSLKTNSDGALISPIASLQAASASLNPTGLTPEGRVQLPVNITFGHEGWANMVAERSAMIASQNLKFAELQLDPPELGPLQVKVTVNQDQANVSFIATSAQVRDALDQTQTRLRELLEEQGVDLVNVDVSDGSSQESESQAQEDGEGAAAGFGDDAANPEEGDANAQTLSVSASYGIDRYV